MKGWEPSAADHNAPYNDAEYEDEETGETVHFCDCTSCRSARRKAARDEARIDDYEERRRGTW